MTREREGVRKGGRKEEGRRKEGGRKGGRKEEGRRCEKNHSLLEDGYLILQSPFLSLQGLLVNDLDGHLLCGFLINGPHHLRKSSPTWLVIPHQLY